MRTKRGFPSPSSSSRSIPSASSQRSSGLSIFSNLVLFERPVQSQTKGMERPSSAEAEGTFPVGRISKVKRHADRARYDRATVHAIIDEAMLCHVAFVVDGQAIALPTAHGRVEDAVYLHGAVANRTLRTAMGAGRA